jgi:hypothetical protein
MHVVIGVETDMFKGTAPRPDAVNDLIGGDEMAAWLCRELKSRGIDASEVWPDDHGWDFNVAHKGCTYLVVCSCDFEDLGAPAREFIVQVSLERSLFDRLLGRRKVDRQQDEILQTVRSTLAANPAITLTFERDR